MDASKQQFHTFPRTQFFPLPTTGIILLLYIQKRFLQHRVHDHTVYIIAGIIELSVTET